MPNAVEAAELVTTWTPLMLAVTRKFSRCWPWLEFDFVSDSTLVLWRCAQSYDPGRGPFPALLKVAVGRACRNCLLRERRRNLAAFLKAGPAKGSDGELVDAIDLVAADDVPVGTGAELAELLDALRPEQRELIERHFFDRERYSDQAAGDGRKPRTVQLRAGRALVKMRKAAGG